MPKQERNGKNGDVHVMFTAKGGVGKTHISSLIAQYSMSAGKPLRVLDLDPSNPMLARLPELQATEVNLVTEGTFDDAKMDRMLREIGASDETFLIDFGASTYQYAWNYFRENMIDETLREWGKRLIYHTVIIAGEELPFTLASYKGVVSAVNGRQIVVWLNPFHGPILVDGKDFVSLEMYKNNEDKIIAVGMLPSVDRTLTGELARLAHLDRTLLNLKQVPEIDVLSRNRLQRHRDKAYEAVKGVMEHVHAEA